MVFLSPPNFNGLLLSTFQARTNPPLTRALAFVTLTPEYCALSSGVAVSPANRPPNLSSEVWMKKVASIASSAAVITAKILSLLPAARRCAPCQRKRACPST